MLCQCGPTSFLQTPLSGVGGPPPRLGSCPFYLHVPEERRAIDIWADESLHQAAGEGAFRSPGDSQVPWERRFCDGSALKDSPICSLPPPPSHQISSERILFTQSSLQPLSSSAVLKEVSLYLTRTFVNTVE